MPRSLWLLVIGTVINVMAASFLWPINTIYIHEHLGKSLTVAGIVLMLNAAATVVGNLVGGVLFDRIGGFKSIILGIVITLVSVVTLMFFHGWPIYIYLLIFIGFGSGIVFPATYALAGTVWPEGGRKAFNVIYVAQNVGVAVGASLGGIVASISFQYSFVANAVFYVVFFIIALLGYRNIDARKASHASILNQNTGTKSSRKFTALAILCIGYLLCWVGYAQWPSTIASHTQNLNIPLNQYSVLWTVNGALILCAQPLITQFVKYVAKTLKQQMIVGFILLIVSFVVTAFAEQFSGFLIAMIILTFGEMLVWPAVPTVADDLAPNGRQGFYQGFVNSAATGGKMIGPLLGGIIADYYHMNYLFMIIISLLTIGIFTTLIYDRKLKYPAKTEEITVHS
ncbi:MDR family MFS transporter [Metabacillus litoralis]|jgi:MFS family permease|uniref:MDR family MFS transporter n=1 Tax=Metabacillus litoralis TaxID=152268 RepID=UPI00203CFF67|nr:MFS transporter [Metabacillus litoralis]MCM3650815.1 MFS transporter [Metabacillus litoralis]